MEEIDIILYRVWQSAKLCFADWLQSEYNMNISDFVDLFEYKKGEYEAEYEYYRVSGREYLS